MNATLTASTHSQAQVAHGHAHTYHRLFAFNHYFQLAIEQQKKNNQTIIAVMMIIEIKNKTNK